MKYDEVKSTEGGWLSVPGKNRKARMESVPVELDTIADAALRYRPKNKAKSLRPKKRKKAE